MKVIIAGSRKLILPITTVELAVLSSRWQITELICGMATGVDTAALYWARASGTPYVPMPAKWDDIEAPNAVVKERADGTTYNVAAGSQRNYQMALCADALIVILRQWTNGTTDMYKKMKLCRKPAFVYWLRE